MPNPNSSDETSAPEKITDGLEVNQTRKTDHVSMWEELSRETELKARRKITARKETKNSTWYALGMLGLVGWSIAIPPLVGAAIGMWIDKRWPSNISWTLTFLLIGLVIGLWNAWEWLKSERSKMEKNQRSEEDDEIE